MKAVNQQQPATRQRRQDSAVQRSGHPQAGNVSFGKESPRIAAQRRQIDSAFGSAIQPQGKKNETGLPNQLKSGVESLSGMSMDNVRVHYNSAKPAQLNALAYAQGSDIHAGPGQEKHLPHEAWHVVQQAQGRVQPTRQMKGSVAVNDDKGLEHEADVMGAKAAAEGERSTSQLRKDNTILQKKTLHASAGGVVQRLLGFELEMHVLVDMNGRPIPEKVTLGTYGAHHLGMVVDHGSAVEAPTPRPAHSAAMTYADPGTGLPRTLGRYDLDTAGPAYDTKVDFHNPNALPLPADPRAAMPPRNDLNPVTWAAQTAGNRYTRPGGGPATPFNNATLVILDNLIGQYPNEVENWETARASVLLQGIQAQILGWFAANPQPGRKHPYNRHLWAGIQARLNSLGAEAVAHRAWWAANPTPPQAVAAAPGVAAVPGMRRHYRQTGVVGAPWSATHPVAAGMGANTYASILEIVTPAFAPETPAGRVNIVAAMTEANNLAAAIEAAAGNNLANRVLLSTIAGTANVPAGVHIGNSQQPNQTTDASIQSTFGVDLHQIPSLLKSIMGMNILGNLQTEFQLKHHSDTYVVHRVDQVAARAPVVARQIIRAAAPGMNQAVGGPQNLRNLRGLLTIMCQYLMMGNHFYGHGDNPLDKNLVPMLSRNDLGSVMFAELVPPAERGWVAGNLAALRAAILHFTGRTGAADVFNDAGEAYAGVFGPTCTQFITNVLTGQPDGITGHLGGFTSFQHGEDVDPTGARGGEHRRVGAAHREGAIFELRNMVPHAALGIVGTDRFPRNRWVPLATYVSDLMAALNARTEAQASHDTRYRQAAGLAPAGLQNEPAPW